MGKLIDKALLTYAEDVIAEAKKQLRKTRTREGKEATWKNGRPTSARTTRHTGRISNTGSLSNSMKARVSGRNSSQISMLAYGQAINDGRRKGKGVPAHALRSWIRRKVRSEVDEKSLSFLINRKIKFFGIEPTHFLDDSFEIVDSRNNDYIYDAMYNEVLEDIKLKNKR